MILKEVTISKIECLMKKFTIIFIIGVVFSYSLQSQNTEWLNYTNGDLVITVASEGIYMWIGTTGGLVKTNTVTGESIFYNKANSGLPENLVSSIALDAQGNKWIGTTGGVAKFDNDNWTVYNSSNSGLPYNMVLSIALDAQGNKWIGTTGGVAKFDDVNWTIYNTSNSGLPAASVSSIAIDAKGNKWFGTTVGVVKFDNINWTIYNRSNSGLPDDWVYSIKIDAQGNKWFGTWGGGIGVFNENGINLGIDDGMYNKSGDFILYPNPAKDMIAIKGLQACTIAIFNSTGKIVKSFKVLGTTTKIDISTLPGGLYVLQAMTKDGMEAKKFIKE
jgi:ligand-binding sensor domain-containing protein